MYFILLVSVFIIFISYFIYKFYNKSPKQYITYEGDCAGFNNRRMGAELIFTLALLYKRTIIIPPPHPWPHINQNSNITDYFDIENLRKKYNIIFASEYEPTKNMNYEDFIRYMEKNKKFDGLEEVNPEVYTFIKCKYIFDKNKDNNIWFFPMCRNNMKIRMLGNFDAYFQNYPSIKSLRKIINQSFKFKKKFKNLTLKTLKLNNIKNNEEYYALHIRKTDFAYYRPHLNKLTELSNIISVIKEHIPPYKKILIISDENNDFFHPLKKFHNIITLKYDPSISKKDIQIIDLLACTYAYKFIGTPLSTYSYYIIILRNQSKKNIDKTIYFLDQNFNCLVANQNWHVKNGWSQIHPDRLIN